MSKRVSNPKPEGIKRPPPPPPPPERNTGYAPAQDFNGRNGNGYQPLSSPPTMEYFKSADYEPDKITFRTLLWFGFCCFCLGVAIGSFIDQ